MPFIIKQGSERAASVEQEGELKVTILGTGAALHGHMVAEEAGSTAREANAKHLLLSHLWPRCDRALALKKAAEAYGGVVELARPGHTYVL